MVQSRCIFNLILVIVTSLIIFIFFFKPNNTITDTLALFTKDRAADPDVGAVAEDLANERLVYRRKNVRVEDDTITIPIKTIMEEPFVLKQDNPGLIKIIRKEYIEPPSTLPYNLKGDTDDPSKGQSAKIRELFRDMRNGFYIECGALDGETRSNSLVFEKVLGWDGVLIEGDPKNFELVLQKRRKAWAVRACLSAYPYPNMVIFEQHFNIGKISSLPLGTKEHRGMAEVQCLPLYSILLALNRTSVDYFSLDVEGHELEVLRTIPWDKVNITTLSVEFIHGKEGKRALRNYMKDQGYKVYAEVTHPRSLANDFIFYHPSLLKRDVYYDFTAEQK